MKKTEFFITKEFYWQNNTIFLIEDIPLNLCYCNHIFIISTKSLFACIFNKEY